MTGTVLIADDEPLARRTLREYLLELGWSGEIHEAQDGLTAITIANDIRPDLLFLDIVMPGATGLEVLEQLDYEPQVIFTTAHDQYAVTAFELGAIDYLLKPFGRERLGRVLRRTQATLNGATVPLLSRARESLPPARSLSRIFVRDGNRILPIPLASLERAQGADDYVTIYSSSKQYLVSVRLSDLEAQLPGTHFLRIHRSHLVNLEYISAIEPYDVARVEVVMKNGTRIVASRSGSRRLRGLAL
ncbi:MAG: LytTR family DNA-binding domain-containing protein [Candidatus Acidiferrum sp.]